MSKRNILKNALILTALLATSAYGSEEISGKVVYAGTYGNGDVYVELDVNINEPGCSTGNRFDVPKARANAKDILSTVYAAIQQDKYVTVRTKGCYVGFPTLDASRNSYFHIGRLIPIESL